MDDLKEGIKLILDTVQLDKDGELSESSQFLLDDLYETIMAHSSGIACTTGNIKERMEHVRDQRKDTARVLRCLGVRRRTFQTLLEDLSSQPSDSPGILELDNDNKLASIHENSQELINHFSRRVEDFADRLQEVAAVFVPDSSVQSRCNHMPFLSHLPVHPLVTTGTKFNHDIWEKLLSISPQNSESGSPSKLRPPSWCTDYHNNCDTAKKSLIQVREMTLKYHQLTVGLKSSAHAMTCINKLLSGTITWAEFLVIGQTKDVGMDWSQWDDCFSPLLTERAELLGMVVERHTEKMIGETYLAHDEALSKAVEAYFDIVPTVSSYYHLLRMELALLKGTVNALSDIASSADGKSQSIVNFMDTSRHDMADIQSEPLRLTKELNNLDVDIAQRITMSQRHGSASENLITSQMNDAEKIAAILKNFSQEGVTVAHTNLIRDMTATLQRTGYVLNDLRNKRIWIPIEAARDEPQVELDDSLVHPGDSSNSSKLSPEH